MRIIQTCVKLIKRWLECRAYARGRLVWSISNFRLIKFYVNNPVRFPDAGIVPVSQHTVMMFVRTECKHKATLTHVVNIAKLP